MNYTFLILALAGLLTNFLMQLATFNKATPEVSLVDTVYNYFHINFFYSIGSLVLTVVLSFLLNQDGGDELISMLTGGNITADKPFAYFATAFIMGFGIDYILSFLRKIINPLKVKLNEMQLPR